MVYFQLVLRVCSRRNVSRLAISCVFVPATMVHESPTTLDPLLAGLVSAFIITAVIITLLLFLKLRRRDNRPEFRRLQDLPMVSTSSTSRQHCTVPATSQNILYTGCNWWLHPCRYIIYRYFKDEEQSSFWASKLQFILLTYSHLTVQKKSKKKICLF